MKLTHTLPGSLIACLLLNVAAFGAQDFQGKDLTGKNFGGQILDGANFTDAILQGAHFNKARLQKANFNGADLTHATFFDADLTGADLREIVAMFLWERVILNEANLEGLDLRNVRLFASKLRGANLKKTKGWNDVTQCDFSNADLRGADLRGATWTGEPPRFRKAAYDETTLWPTGFDPKEVGATPKAAEPKEATAPAQPPQAPAAPATPAPQGQPATPELPPLPKIPPLQVKASAAELPQAAGQALSPALPALPPITAPAAQPARAGLTGGKPVGLFFMTRYWSYTRTLEKAAWYFSPDGQVYEKLESGFSPEDLAAHKGRKGTARMEGNVMAVTWTTGGTSRSEIEPDRGSAGFMWDMGMFSPVQSFAGPDSIVGTYEGGESLSHGGNAAAVAKTLTLRADGSFAMSGVSSLKGNTDTSRLYAGSQGATTGNWQLSGYSLTLAANDGAVTRRIAFPYNDGTSRRLFLGGMMFKRQ